MLLAAGEAATGLALLRELAASPAGKNDAFLMAEIERIGRIKGVSLASP